jgi:hypothetical protein
MNRRVLLLTSCLTLCCACLRAQLLPKHHLAQGQLPARSQQVFADSMALFDASYDPVAHLVLHPQDGGTHVHGKYMVRESSWYALGLLTRDRLAHRPQDVARALEVIKAVLPEQYLDSQTKWYGTFKRTPEEPGPRTGSIAFTAYDPNWRHFIGTTFEMMLIEYSDKLPAELQTRMYRAIDAAVAGEMHDGRLLPSYTNIALMYGALWDFAATHDHNADWSRQSAAWVRTVYGLYRQYDTVSEYNAPTYFGVDIYGLALWREYGSNETMRGYGRAMESGLWLDIANYYQPQLRNVTGPYDRAYGMDMSAYVTPTGVWLRTVMDANAAPLPEHATLHTFQVADMWFAPHIVMLGTRIPAAALAKFRSFSGPHRVNRRIDAKRVATAWVGQTAIWGGEFTGLTKDTGGATQFHPVDVQWKLPSGQIGWTQLTRSPNLDATADAKGITIATSGDVSFRVFCGQDTGDIEQGSWRLPGMKVDVKGDATSFTQTRSADGFVDMTYRNVHALRMEIQPENAPGAAATH